MADQLQPFAAFESRLARTLTAYGEAAVRPIDPIAIAERASLVDRRRTARRSWTWMAAAAVLLLLALLAAAALGGARPSVFDLLGQVPTMPPTQAPTKAPVADGFLPVDLVHDWYGGTRDLPLLTPGAGTLLTLSGNDARLRQSDPGSAPLLRESASIVGGRLQVVSTVPETHGDGVTCPEGTTGLYDTALSDSGNTLTIRSFNDPCVGRAAALAGTWWKRACLADGDCYGMLDAGTYATQLFDPRVDPGAGWAPRFGGLTFTVPEGWALAVDGPSGIRLTPDYAGEQANGNVPTGLEGDVLVLAQPYPIVDGDQDCFPRASPALDAPRSPTEIATFLAAQPWLDASAPSTSTIGGHAAIAFDLAIKPGTKPGCPEDTDAHGEYLTVFGPDSWMLGLAGNQRAHLVLIDIGQGDVVAVALQARNAAELAGHVATAMPVIASFRFE